MAYHYQQSPDGPTVIHPVVVVKPELPKLQPDGYVPSSCVLFPGVCGGMLLIVSFILCCVVAVEVAFKPSIRGPYRILLIIGIVLGVIAVALCGICCCGWKMGKNKYNKLHRQEKENPAPRYEPYTDDEISAACGYSGQGQPGLGQPVEGKGSPMYVPIQSGVSSATHLT